MAVAMKRRNLLSFYGIILAFHLLCGIAFGIFSIHTIFQEGILDWTGNCTDQSENMCRNQVIAVKGIIVAFFIVSWLFQFCTYSHRCVTSY